MHHIASSILDLVGRTPLLDISWLGGHARLLAKLEAFNPSGSVKARAALSMVLEAERRGELRRGGCIIEPTSGNTGVGLAMVAAVRGYSMVVVMPETMSLERRRLMRAYGADVVLTPGGEGMPGAIARAEELAGARPGAVLLQQFDNPANPAAHIATAQEVWEDTEGQVDAVVAGVGTGGTLVGMARALKSKKPDIQVIALEPESSAVLQGGAPAPHGIQGIGAGFIPAVYDATLVDGVISVPDAAAIATTLRLAREGGVLGGISSGAAAWGACQLAARPEYEGRTIVCILPDTGERYLSSGIFD